MIHESVRDGNESRDGDIKFDHLSLYLYQVWNDSFVDEIIPKEH